MSDAARDKPDFAFYYPGPMWQSAESIKNLLLFFDGIGLLVPRYLEDKPERIDPSLAIPLRDRGLLINIEPEEHIDKAATEELAEALTELIASGLFDELAKDENGAFHELSMSRLGYYGDRELARMLFEELKQRGLARESEDGLSIPMHSRVRVLILVLLAQILRPRGDNIGISLSPATDQARVVSSLIDLLEAPMNPSAGHVVASDLETVGADLSNIPLDEILDFRNQYRQEYRSYARNVRTFVRDLSRLDEEQRTEAVEDRQEQLSDLANDLRRRSRRAWKKPARFALGAAGAVWASAGDPLGLLLTLSAASLHIGDSTTNEAGAFTYVFAVPPAGYI